jgi:DMSO/TMAO reductase YedYZ molybdopterin-dependent catalytic subunit
VNENVGSPVGRRVVLGMLGLGAVGVAVGSRIQDSVQRALQPLGPGVQNLLPAAGGFRYYSVTGGVPHRTTADYTMTVKGMVREPRTLTFADLQALPQTTLVKDFQCVTGWRVPKVPWSGVRLRDMLTLAGVQSSAKALRFLSFDGTYTESLTLDQAQNPDMLVATRMLNGPVSHDHGGPVRLYAAPMYGYKSIKWLSEIQVVDAVHPGYWEGFGYDIDAWVGKSNGRTGDVPTG